MVAYLPLEGQRATHADFGDGRIDHVEGQHLIDAIVWRLDEVRDAVVTRHAIHFLQLGLIDLGRINA